MNYYDSKGEEGVAVVHWLVWMLVAAVVWVWWTAAAEEDGDRRSGPVMGKESGVNAVSSW